ncbi:MAG: PKD domain-containing protein [Myxococcales bacterium]|nr:PKD domain-containing protein [Myxococcales bacterium]
MALISNRSLSCLIGSIAAVFLFLAGCAEQSAGAPSITGISPPIVSSLVGTTLRIEGENFLGHASASFDNDDAPAVNASWTVSIGTLPALPATLTETTQLQVTIPAGVEPGIYDVSAHGPSGQITRLPNALSVVAAPIGLSISIETAPDGSGQPIGNREIEAGSELPVYAVVRDTNDAFLQSIDVTWSIDAPIGTIEAGPASGAILLGQRVGIGFIEAVHSVAAKGRTGPVEIRPGPTERLSIEDTANGTGTEVADILGLTTDDSLVFFAVGRDAFDNVTEFPDVTWETTGTLESVADGLRPSTTMEFTTPGVGTLRILHESLEMDTTGTLAVVAGRAAALAIAPNILTASADDAPTSFSALAVDADGNPTSDLGVISWSIGSGPISTINATTGVFAPTAAGSGTVRATSSYGPVHDSGTIAVQPGIASSMVITPNVLTISADASATTFSAAGTDADGNATSSLGVLSWSIASGGITAIDPLTGSFAPTAAGSGTIKVTSNLGAGATTGTVTVEPGQAVAIQVTPDTLSTTIGDSDTAFSASGTDSDGNVTSDLGTVAWTSNSVTAIDGVTGLFTPSSPGLGFVTATSSHGPSDDSGEVRVHGGLEIISMVHPPAASAYSDGVPMAIQVRHLFSEEVLITGIWFTFDAGGDVTSEYVAVSSTENEITIAPATTEELVFAVSIDSAATLGTIGITANAEGFVPSFGYLERASFLGSWVISSSTPVAAQISSPVAPDNRICVGDAVTFDSLGSAGSGSLSFLWNLAGGTPGTSTSNQPANVTYSSVGSFPYSLTVTDDVSQSIRFSDTPIYVGTAESTVEDQYITGVIEFDDPTSGQLIDMATLPDSHLVDQGGSQRMTQCDGTTPDTDGQCFVTLFVDRGTLDLSRDTRLDLPGIQVQLHNCDHFDNVKLDNDPQGLEGRAMVYAEVREQATDTITASGFVEFEMVGDSIAPTVDSTSPGASCTGPCFGQGHRLVFKFSEPMDESTIIASTKIETSLATDCSGSSFVDITAASSLSYDESSRSLRVVPEVQATATYSVRTTVTVGATDSSTNSNPLSVPISHCVVLEDRPTPLSSPAPSSVTLTASPFSPDGDGDGEEIVISLVADAAATAIVAKIQRGDTVVRTLLETVDGAGTYLLRWDGRDSSGRVVPDGHYSVLLRTENAEGVASPSAITVVLVDSAIGYLGVPSRF